MDLWWWQSRLAAVIACTRGAIFRLPPLYSALSSLRSLEMHALDGFLVADSVSGSHCTAPSAWLGWTGCVVPTPPAAAAAAAVLEPTAGAALAPASILDHVCIYAV